jgi:hypothetical protein|tara:strand:- start:391 stop:600 length:210 start_codon:yes stop_codon:yes gene_type:complete
MELTFEQTAMASRAAALLEMEVKDMLNDLLKSNLEMAADWAKTSGLSREAELDDQSESPPLGGSDVSIE